MITLPKSYSKQALITKIASMILLSETKSLYIRPDTIRLSVEAYNRLRNEFNCAYLMELEENTLFGFKLVIDKNLSGENVFIYNSSVFCELEDLKW